MKARYLSLVTDVMEQLKKSTVLNAVKSGDNLFMNNLF